MRCSEIGQTLKKGRGATIRRRSGVLRLTIPSIQKESPMSHSASTRVGILVAILLSSAPVAAEDASWCGHAGSIIQLAAGAAPGIASKDANRQMMGIGTLQTNAIVGEGAVMPADLKAQLSEFVAAADFSVVGDPGASKAASEKMAEGVVAAARLAAEGCADPVLGQLAELRGGTPSPAVLASCYQAFRWVDALDRLKQAPDALAIDTVYDLTASARYLDKDMAAAGWPDDAREAMGRIVDAQAPSSSETAAYLTGIGEDLATVRKETTAICG
jgi:hypothetical protein